jgi:hypothetical protein
VVPRQVRDSVRGLDVVSRSEAAVSF